MAVHVSHASIPYPIKNARYSFLVPFLDADGDPTDPTTPDTEVSQDNGSFADAAEEVATASGTNGMGLITLTGAETNNSTVGVAFKVASGPKATLMTLYPRNLAIVSAGTLSAGSAGGGTLGTVLAYDVCGCFLRTTGGTGGGGTGGASNQARRIITYTTSSGAFTVSPNWETTPSTDTTYDVLLPEGMTLGTLKALTPTTAGRTLDVSTGGEAGVDWANVGSPTTSLALTGTTIAVTQKVDIDTIKTNPVVNGGTITFPTTATLASTTNITAGTIATATNVTTVNGLAANVITATSIAADAITAAKIADGAIDAATFATAAITATAIAADAITDAKVASDVTIASVTGAVGSVTGAVGSVTGNVGGNVTGSVGSLATQAKADVNAEADTALSDVGLTTTITGRVDAAVSTRATPAQVLTQVNAALDAAMTEIASDPGATPSLRQGAQLLYMALRNKFTNTASIQTIFNDAGSAVLANTISDDGTVYTKGKFS